MVSLKKYLLRIFSIMLVLTFLFNSKILAETQSSEILAAPMYKEKLSNKQSEQIKKAEGQVSILGGLYWDRAWLDPASTVYVSSTVLIYYWVSFNSVPIGDSFSWRFYRPVLDPDTFLPTGDTTLMGPVATWTRYDANYWDWSNGISSYRYSFGGSPDLATGIYIKDSPPAGYPGTWSVTVTRTHSGTTELLTSANFTLVDNLAPRVSFISPTAGTIAKRSIDIQISNSDNLKVMKLDLYADNTSTSQSFLLQSYIKPSGAIMYTWNTGDYPVGKYTLRAVASDPYNNIGSATVNLEPPSYTIGVVEMSTDNDVGLSGVTDPIFTANFDADGKIVVTNSKPIGEMVNDNFGINITLDAYPSKPNWDPEIEWKWQIAGLGGSTSGISVKGWNISDTIIPAVTKPTARVFGDHNMKLSFTFKDNVGGRINTQVENLNLKLFFDKDAVYIPGGDPNWFEYWPKESATTTIIYSNVIFAYGAYITDADQIFIFKPAAGYDIVTGHTGVHTFEETIAHENKHREIWFMWWPRGVYNPSDDLDGDSVPDAWEASPAGQAALFQVGRYDERDEIYENELCERAEWDVDEESYNGLDWAYHGKQTN